MSDFKAKGTKFDFGWGSAQTPLGDLAALPQTRADPIPLSAIRASKQLASPNVYP